MNKSSPVSLQIRQSGKTSDYTLGSIDLRLFGYTADAGDVALLQIFSDSTKTSTDPS